MFFYMKFTFSHSCRPNPIRTSFIYFFIIDYEFYIIKYYKMVDFSTPLLNGVNEFPSKVFKLRVLSFCIVLL